jgi:DNA-binding GntR family transcriptional regulator
MFTIDPLGNPEPAYRQIADAIAAGITAGAVTGRLPAERQLAADLGVACQTVRHAMRVLRDHGLIITRQGRGSFVAASAHVSTPADEPGSERG